MLENAGFKFDPRVIPERPVNAAIKSAFGAVKSLAYYKDADVNDPDPDMLRSAFVHMMKRHLRDEHKARLLNLTIIDYFHKVVLDQRDKFLAVDIINAFSEGQECFENTNMLNTLVSDIYDISLSCVGFSTTANAGNAQNAPNKSQYRKCVDEIREKMVVLFA
jgi:hypothetical protein